MLYKQKNKKKSMIEFHPIGNMKTDFYTVIKRMTIELISILKV